MAQTFQSFCDRLSELRVDRSSGVPKPYKPVLLAAVILLVHKRKIVDRRVLLDGGLRSAFQQVLSRLYPGCPLCQRE